jgi:uncharacterized protein YqeY
MSLAEKINEDLKNAMKQKNEAALRALRSIKSAILLARTEKGGSDELTEQQENQILQKMAKQRRESIDIFRQQNRQDLADAEVAELKIIENFLPQQLSEDEIRQKIKAIIANAGVSGGAAIGKVMPLAMKELGGKAEGKIISAIVKEELGS